MSQSTAELILWILLVFFIGCILGYILRGLLGRRAARGERAAFRGPPTGSGADPTDEEKSSTTLKASELASRAVTVEPPARTDPNHEHGPVEPPQKIQVRQSEPAQGQQGGGSKTVPGANGGSPPKGLPAPRGGSPDPLQRISGVGPKIEGMLHDLGIFHFDQIAGWTEEQGRWVDGHLKFKGRIGRDEWVKQARLLADGKEEEFATLYGKSGLMSAGGTRRKGNRTVHH
jgi:predicted flap endonuclease-1-like 5' DNA nuclease